ncbi:MAG TPA: D-alanyl-D-alanine carboxypeptidase/D-alanyl-D-alanine-endopeptidase [Marmoricola sp.]|nr:D-alanyl-D-alanine carboxypeptidase/D-alanyl-D-alanine-endopeptidase [Marmoricola sp.]
MTDLLAGLVVLCLVLAGAAHAFDLGERLGIAAPDPSREPAAVVPPAGLELPEPATAAAVAPPLTGGTVSSGEVRRALGRLTEDRRLGRRVAVAVAGVDGAPVYSEGPDVVTPASTLKIITSLAALAALGPQHRFATTTVLAGNEVTLVGGGDPFLEREPDPDAGYPERADLATLARRTAVALEKAGRERVRLRYDATLFTGPAGSPDWEDDYLPDDVVSPITSLWVDEGREQPGLVFRSANPAGDAALYFAERLRRAGIAVVGRPRPDAAPERARRLAEVRSAELVEVVQRILEVSDNEGAEVLARHVALATGAPASFVGGATAVREVVEGLGVPMRGARILDGSGLARGDRLPVGSLLAAMATALDPAHAELSGAVEGLPVAGFSGSLAYRFVTSADAALGRVRAKTGTLTGVHGLAGVVTGRDDSVMLFVAIADRVKPVHTLFVRDRLDQIAAALAGCACAR